MNGSPQSVHRDIIVIGASAGGVETLSRLVGDLPVDLPAAVFIVMHLPSNGFSVLPQILSRAGRLPAHHPEDGETIRLGRIYVAPSDHHLLLHAGHVRLVRGPRENRCRPAVDPLFRTAASIYGPRVIGVVLTGALDDGTAGLLAVKRRGGLAIVQHPQDALFPGMPTSAIRNVAVDFILPSAEVGRKLVELAGEPSTERENASMRENGADGDRLEYENRIVEMDEDAIEDEQRSGDPSPFACPECGGVLWEVENGQLLRFRCRVGHAFTAHSLLAAQTEGLEAALWSALRALEEKASLSRRLSSRAREQAHHGVATRFSDQAERAEEHAETIRKVLLHAGRGHEEEIDAAAVGW